MAQPPILRTYHMNMRVFGSKTMVVVATYPSAGGRRGAHECVFQGRKVRGVATNVYSRKMSEKPEHVVYEP
ncbi:hypothetical protein HKD37_02G005230 [Glycine soja]